MYRYILNMNNPAIISKNILSMDIGEGVIVNRSTWVYSEKNIEVRPDRVMKQEIPTGQVPLTQAMAEVQKRAEIIRQNEEERDRKVKEENEAKMKIQKQLKEQEFIAMLRQVSDRIKTHDLPAEAMTQVLQSEKFREVATIENISKVLDTRTLEEKEAERTPAPIVEEPVAPVVEPVIENVVPVEEPVVDPVPEPEPEPIIEVTPLNTEVPPVVEKKRSRSKS